MPNCSTLDATRNVTPTASRPDVELADVDGLLDSIEAHYDVTILHRGPWYAIMSGVKLPKAQAAFKWWVERNDEPPTAMDLIEDAARIKDARRRPSAEQTDEFSPPVGGTDGEGDRG